MVFGKPCDIKGVNKMTYKKDVQLITLVKFEDKSSQNNHGMFIFLDRSMTKEKINRSLSIAEVDHYYLLPHALLVRSFFPALLVPSLLHGDYCSSFPFFTVLPWCRRSILHTEAFSFSAPSLSACRACTLLLHPFPRYQFYVQRTFSLFYLHSLHAKMTCPLFPATPLCSLHAAGLSCTSLDLHAHPCTAREQFYLSPRAQHSRAIMQY